jgi:3,4-dihydroxyphthalate decarboxylase
VRRLDFDGAGRGLGPTHYAPHETPLHGEVYKARRDVGAVVHVHPRYALLCSVVGVEFTPIIGGFAPQLARIAILGVPEYPRAATVTNKDMAREMVQAMADRDIVLLRGHGIAATGPNVEAATTLALRFESLCELMWQVTLSGRKPYELSQVDKDRYDPRNPNPLTFPAERDFQAARRRSSSGGDEEGGIGWGGYVERVRQSVGLPGEEFEPGDQ